MSLTLGNKCRENNATIGLLSSLARSDVPLPTTTVDDRRVERTLRRPAASMSAALALALRDTLRARAQERVDGSRLRRRSRRRRVRSHRPLRRSRSPRARRRLVAARQASSPRARQPPQWHSTSISSPRLTHAQARRPSRRIARPSHRACRSRACRSSPRRRSCSARARRRLPPFAARALPAPTCYLGGNVFISTSILCPKLRPKPQTESTNRAA